MSQFSDSGVNVTCEGQPYLGAAIGTPGNLSMNLFRNGLLRLYTILAKIAESPRMLHSLPSRMVSPADGEIFSTQASSAYHTCVTPPEIRLISGRVARPYISMAKVGGAFFR